MPAITALLHTENDALRLGRALETLYPCDDVLIVDHDSRDETIRVARDYGARIVEARAGASPEQYFRSAHSGWILCLDPRESLSESLAASLYEWKALHADAVVAPAYSVFLRQEAPEGWLEIATPQTRLVPQSWIQWEGNFPRNRSSALTLAGELLRFFFP